MNWHRDGIVWLPDVVQYPWAARQKLHLQIPIAVLHVSLLQIQSIKERTRCAQNNEALEQVNNHE